ncbi:hypothetical protein LOS22_12175 [Enterococcus faecium]|nr:hypothetical protein [Enterococcus faecium]
MKITIPKNFILGAASSAWQTEGWKGKKEGQDSFIDSWYKMNILFGIMGMAQP